MNNNPNDNVINFNNIQRAYIIYCVKCSGTLLSSTGTRLEIYVMSSILKVILTIKYI